MSFGTRWGPGLCGESTHARIVETRRGSAFMLCGRSRDDARFPRYPVLPMLRCPGFAHGTPIRRSEDDGG